MSSHNCNDFDTTEKGDNFLSLMYYKKLLDWYENNAELWLSVGYSFIVYEKYISSWSCNIYFLKNITEIEFLQFKLVNF